MSNVVPIPQSGIKPIYVDVARTRVTSGRSTIHGIDGRSYYARRLRDLMALHIADLGGVEACSEAEKSIIRRIAVLTVESERVERRFAKAEADHVSYIDLDLYQRVANTLRRLLDMTGLERRSRDITPTIDQYLADTDVTDVETD